MLTLRPVAGACLPAWPGPDGGQWGRVPEGWAGGTRRPVWTGPQGVGCLLGEGVPPPGGRATPSSAAVVTQFRAVSRPPQAPVVPLFLSLRTQSAASPSTVGCGPGAAVGVSWKVPEAAPPPCGRASSGPGESRRDCVALRTGARCPCTAQTRSPRSRLCRPLSCPRPTAPPARRPLSCPVPAPRHRPPAGCCELTGRPVTGKCPSPPPE